MKKYKFKTNSDTEVLFALLKQISIEDALKQIKGMFAFIFFDSYEKTFYAARDHFGQKPLYYCSKENMFAISSNIKSLNLIADSAPDINQYNLYLASNGIIEKKNTFFKKIKRLEAGSYIYGKKNSYKIYKYFSPIDLYQDNQPESSPIISFNESLENLDFLMKQSVSRHLVGDVRLGVFLSGGIDSSLLYYYSRLQKNDVSSFTSFSPKIEKNSFINVPKIVKKFPIKNNHYIIQARTNYIKDLIELIEDTHNLPVWGGGPPMSRLCKMAKQKNVKVLLSGDAVDEISGGYRTMLKLFKKNNLNKNDLHEILSLQQYDFIEKNKSFKEFKNSILSERKKILYKFRNLKNLKDIIANTLLIEDTSNFLQMSTLPHSDEYSMFNSIELRNPFLDMDLVKYVINEPMNHKINNQQGKLLFTKLAENKIGKFINKRNKEGTRNYSKYISNQQFWKFQNFHILDILNINKLPSKTPFKLVYKMIALEIFHRSVVLKENNYLNQILSNKGLQKLNT